MALPQRLLPELILQVIEQLAGQVHPDAYLFPNDVRDTLWSLARVSRVTRAFTLPLSFQRVVLTSAGLELFYHQYFKQDPNKHLLHHIEAFAVIDFDKISNTDAQQLSELFVAMSTSLKRLTIDLPLRNYHPPDSEDEDETPEIFVRTPLRRAMSQFTQLVEFVSIRDELYLHAEGEARYTIWPEWNSLQRLALYNPDISPHFLLALASLPHIHTLVFARHDDDDDDPSLTPLIKNSSGLKDVFLLDPGKWRLAAVRPVFQERRDVRIRLYLPEGEDHDTKEWYRTRVLDGTLWEFEGDIDRGLS